MSKAVQGIQIFLASVAVTLVAALFFSGVGGQNRDQLATSAPATPAPAGGTESGRAVATGQRMPGMPERDLASYETFPRKAGANANRQLDYKVTQASKVTFAKSLTSYEAYAAQKVEWRECGKGGLCAKVFAPLDWAKPDGPAIELAIAKYVNGNSSHGALFVNPGGPGAGGISLAESLTGKWQNYDIIGWDPRGTGNSTPVVCGSAKETDDWLSLDESPDDAAEDAALREGAAKFARQCRDASGPLLDHLSTVDVVRDLDLLRHLVGAEKLNYFGVSYGTYVGATYATLFPHSVGRMILDAAVEITGKDEVPQVAGFELAFNNFTKWCASSTLCDLGDDQAVVNQKIADFLQGLDQKPLKVGNRVLTQSRAATGVALFLYEDETAYRTLAGTLAAAMSGDGSILLQAADALTGRGDDGKYATLTYAFPAMSCADWSDEGADAVTKEWRDTFAKAPVMGPNMGMSYTCPFWTADSAPELKLTGEGAPEIVVVGTTGDSATPYEQAVSMSKQLVSASLLTLDGAGHGAVTGSNSCIKKAIDSYLYDGTVPQDGMVCR